MNKETEAFCKAFADDIEIESRSVEEDFDNRETYFVLHESVNGQD